jgi:hypothetical protein
MQRVISVRPSHNLAVRVFLTLFRRGFAAHSASSQSHNPKRASLAVRREFRGRSGKTVEKTLVSRVSPPADRVGGLCEPRTQIIADARDTACSHACLSASATENPTVARFATVGFKWSEDPPPRRARPSEHRDDAKPSRFWTFVARGVFVAAQILRPRPHQWT